MDLLKIAEENFLISFAIVVAIGILQGVVLGRGIRERFPSFKVHARVVSIILLILFSINASFSVITFADPEKISISDLELPETPEQGLVFLFDILGLNAGFVTVVAIFISIIIILLLRFANLSGLARYFVFSISVVMVVLALISRFTDYVPTTFQIFMYAFYQFGFTLGIFLVTLRKQKDVLSDLK